MAKTSFGDELQKLVQYLRSDSSEDAKRPLIFPLFQKLFKDKFKTESDANGADGYVEGQLIIETKTDYFQWLDGFYQALHYHKAYGLSFNTIIFYLFCLTCFNGCCIFPWAFKADKITGLIPNYHTIKKYPDEVKNLILIPIVKNGKWGYADTNLHIVLPAIYYFADKFQGNYAVVGVKTDSVIKCGLIDKNGNLILPFKFNNILCNYQNLFALVTDKGLVIINSNFKRINNEIYDHVLVSFYKQNPMIVIRNEKRAIIDIHGKHITDFLYDESGHFENGFCPMQIDGKWGLIDSTGKTTVDFKFTTLYGSKTNLKVAQNGDCWGVLNVKGDTIIPFSYNYIIGDADGDRIIAQVKSWNDKKNIQNTIYNRQGKIIGRNNLDYCDDYCEGLAVFRSDTLFGFVDTSGKVIIQPQYQWACGFFNGLAWVKLNNKYGFINKNNKVVIQIKYLSRYDYVYMDKYGTDVRLDSVKTYFYIDKNGKEYR